MNDKEKLMEHISKMLEGASEEQLHLVYIVAREILKK